MYICCALVCSLLCIDVCYVCISVYICCALLCMYVVHQCVYMLCIIVYVCCTSVCIYAVHYCVCMLYISVYNMYAVHYCVCMLYISVYVCTVCMLCISMYECCALVCMYVCVSVRYGYLNPCATPYILYLQLGSIWMFVILTLLSIGILNDIEQGFGHVKSDSKDLKQLQLEQTKIKVLDCA